MRDDGHGGGQQVHGAARQVRGRQLEVQVRLRDPRGHAVQEDVRHLAGKRILTILTLTPLYFVGLLFVS